MAKSNSLNISTVETIVNNTVQYLNQWTKKELVSLLEKQTSNGVPLIAQIGKKGYIVGNYALQPIDHQWWRVSYRFNDEVEQVFSSKLSALCYIFYRHNNDYQHADQILNRDNNFRRWAIKSQHYQYRYKQALKKKNYLKSELFLARYQETQHQLNLSKIQLEKSLKLAKYFKL